MAEWKSSYGGTSLDDARLLTSEEIKERYPDEANSHMAQLTREFVKKGYDILYGKNSNLSTDDFPDDDFSDDDFPIDDFPYYDWREDVVRTAAELYKTMPDKIILRGYTDMSDSKAIYVAVKLR